MGGSLMGFMEGTALGGMLCGLVLGGAIGSLISAVIMRVTIALYNRLASGGDAEVDEPEYSKAWGIMFTAYVVNIVIGFLIGLLTQVGAAEQMGPSTQITRQLILVVTGFLVLTGVLTVMLPTTFVRGLAITGLYTVITIALVFAIVIVVFGVMWLFSLLS